MEEETTLLGYINTWCLGSDIAQSFGARRRGRQQTVASGMVHALPVCPTPSVRWPGAQAPPFQLPRPRFPLEPRPSYTAPRLVRGHLAEAPSASRSPLQVVRVSSSQGLHQ